MSDTENFKEFLADLESGTVDFEAHIKPFTESMQRSTNKEDYIASSLFRDLKDYCIERSKGKKPSRLVHPEFPFRHGSKVTYESNEGTQYCIVSYVNYLGAFILVYFPDDKFEEPMEGDDNNVKTDMLYHVGIDVLELLEE